MASFHDISARKDAEDELLRIAERLSIELTRRQRTEIELRAREAELSAFAGMVAHDLKAPLRAVSGSPRSCAKTWHRRYPVV